jgi:hypothetical protein
MPTVTRPITAAIGILPTVVDGVRRLPMKAATLPVRALSGALTGIGTARREYVQLAQRGEQLVRRVRGTSFDEVEDRVEDVVGRTRAGGAYDRVEDTLEDVTDKVRGLATATLSLLPFAPSQPEAVQTKVRPTPKVTTPTTTRVDTAATDDVVEIVEQVSGVIDVEPVVDRDDLPLADYDHMTLGSLRSRLRALTLEQLVQLRDYEKSKGDRLPVITMFDNRIAKLATGDAKPSGGSTTAPAPEQRVRASRGSKVTPATSGPPVNPTTGGDPTNPGQPR